MSDLMEHTLSDPAAFELTPDLRLLRDECLALHKLPKGDLPEQTIAVAEAWSSHTDDEPWAIWKARRFAARLHSMPVPLSPGEIVIGKPGLTRDELPAELAARVDAARAVLESMPNDPGGDTGHHHPDYAAMFRRGVGGTLDEIRQRRAETTDADTITFYDSCEMAMQAFSDFIVGMAADCEAMVETDSARAETWTKLAQI